MRTTTDKELDPKFKYDVAAQPGGENIKRCFACGVCTGGCLVSEIKDDPEYAEPALAFSKKIQDISEFLTQSISLRQDLGEIRGKVTYHDPCHLVREQKVAHQPRQLLNLIPGLELIEMKEADVCCGGAGSYNLTDENLYTCSQDSQQQIKEKIEEHNLNRVVVASCSPRTHEPL